MVGEIVLLLQQIKRPHKKFTIILLLLKFQESVLQRDLDAICVSLGQTLPVI